MTDDKDRSPADRPRRERGPWWSLGAWFLLALGGAHLWAYFTLPATFVDGTYRQDIYPWLLKYVGGLTDRVPWSVAGGLVLFALILLGLRLLHLLSTLFAPGFPRRVLAALFHLAVLLALLVHPLLAGWVWHYRGTPLEGRLNLRPATPLEVHRLVLERAVAEVNALRPRALDARTGDPPPVARRVEATFKALGLPAPTLPERIKHPPIPGMLLLSGTLGITAPFTLEAHVEPGLHWADTPFVQAHELAHLAGIPGEGAANFIAWHALVTSPHPRHRYLGWLGILPHTARWEAYKGKLDKPVRLDLEALFARRRQGRLGWLAALQGWVYDGWLKTQGVSAGTADYARAALLAAAWLKAHPRGPR